MMNREFETLDDFKQALYTATNDWLVFSNVNKACREAVKAAFFKLVRAVENQNRIVSMGIGHMDVEWMPPDGEIRPLLVEHPFCILNNLLVSDVWFTKKTSCGMSYDDFILWIPCIRGGHDEYAFSGRNSFELKRLDYKVSCLRRMPRLRRSRRLRRSFLKLCANILL